MDKNQALAVTIEELGFKSNTRNTLVELIQRDIDEESYFSRAVNSKKRLELCACLARIYTVKDLIRTKDKQLRRHAPRHPLIIKVEKDVADRLVAIGLSKLDWIALPASSVTDSMLLELGLEKLRDLPVVVLGTLSHVALIYLEHQLNKEAPDITIGNLIDCQYSHVIDGIKSSLETTRQRLKTLGFSYESGPFFQRGTKRALIEDLVAKEGVTPETAGVIAEISVRRGWVRPFVV